MEGQDLSWLNPIKQFRKVPAGRWSAFLRAVCIDVLMLNISLALSFALFYNFQVPRSVWGFIAQSSLILTPLGVFLLTWQGLYRTHARYIGFNDFMNVAFASLVLAIALGALKAWNLFRFSEPFVVAVPVLFGLLNTAMLVGIRILRRLRQWRSVSNSKGELRRRTLVVGAGDAGEMIIREIARSQSSDYYVVGFVDDNPHKNSLQIHGVKGYGTTEDIPRLAQEHAIEEILIAIPSAHGSDIRRIFNLCRQTGARVRILPSIPAIFEGEATLGQFREVHIEDLLRRDPVTVELRDIAIYLSGERVLITGAGGSIGSELARQIAGFGPASLILLGKGENSIYEIEQELVHMLGFRPQCMIADVRDSNRMQEIMREEQPTVVFHAAAHKHVPLMEANPSEAIKNNVLGTLVTVDAAVRMIVSAYSDRSETDFAIVRFGNVLGSRGSLIPTLQSQIARGGPVCITHPDMTRYFMTIPEAVQLIIQAGAMGHNGGIFILDMGEPVRILDLAYDLIRLYGLVPGKDIKIIFTGQRPGEKLSEELFYQDETLIRTKHPKIQVAKNGEAPNWKWLHEEIDTLVELCEREQTETARELLMALAWGKRSPYPTTISQMGGKA
jgi:FlaA1/EpsC-like NDP-sugar epimerase